MRSGDSARMPHKAALILIAGFFLLSWANMKFEAWGASLPSGWPAFAMGLVGGSAIAVGARYVRPWLTREGLDEKEKSGALSKPVSLVVGTALGLALIFFFDRPFFGGIILALSTTPLLFSADEETDA